MILLVVLIFLNADLCVCVDVFVKAMLISKCLYKTDEQRITLMTLGIHETHLGILGLDCP